MASVIAVGVPHLAQALRDQEIPVQEVRFTPPRTLPAVVKEALAHLTYGAAAARVREANREAVDRVSRGRALWVDVVPAREASAFWRRRALSHAGPPQAWQDMTPMLRAALAEAACYEGWAEDPREAEALLQRGEVVLASNAQVGAVGPMTGVISPSMPVAVVESGVPGRRVYTNLNEGLGPVLRFGATGPAVRERLRWLEEVAGPALGHAVRHLGGLDLTSLVGRALTMGDELHQRNVAASGLLLRALLPALAATGRLSGPGATRLASYLADNEQLFLNFAMAAAKALLLPLSSLPGCSLVTAMARNGKVFGIQVGGTGERWFTAPAPTPRGLYFPGFGPEDAHPDVGDSAILETIGLGGAAMAVSPAVAQFVGEDPALAWETTEAVQAVTFGQHAAWGAPPLSSPLTWGIDVRWVVATGRSPIINTGIAHRDPGVGQIGAGTVTAPLECFDQALLALAEEVRP